MRRFLIATAALVVVAALALLGTRLLMSDTAAHGPTTVNVDLVGIDMNTTGNGGDASGGVIGVRETCGTISGTGTLNIDITVDEVPTDRGISGFGFTLNFDKNVVVVSSSSMAVSIIGLDPDSSGVANVGDASSNDGTFTPGGVDWSTDVGIDTPPFTLDTNPSETGEGVLIRATLQGVASGTSTLTITSEGVGGDDLNPVPILNVGSAIVVVDGACPEADLSVTQTLDPAVPVTANASTNVIVDVDKVIHNAGGLDDVAGTLTTTVTVPAGCTANASAGPLVIIQTVPAPPLGLIISNNLLLTETLTLHCADPSTHVFTIENEVQPIGTTDSNQGDNVVSNTFTINSEVSADVGIDSWSTSSSPAPTMLPILVPRICAGINNNAGLDPLFGKVGPTPAFQAACEAELTMGTTLIKQNEPIDVTKVISNTGGYTPVNVDVTPTGSFLGNVNIPCYVVAKLNVIAPQTTKAALAGGAPGWDCANVGAGMLGTVLMPVGATTLGGGPECSVSSPTPYMVSVDAVPVPSVENFAVNCAFDSFGIEAINPPAIATPVGLPWPMAFSFDNAVAPNDPHVIDGNATNDTADPPLLLWAVPAFNPTFAATIDDTDPGNPLTYPTTNNCVIIQACEFLTDYGVPLAQQETALGITYIPQATILPTNGFQIASGHPGNAVLGPTYGGLPASAVWAGPGLTNGSQVGVFTFSIRILGVPGACVGPVSGIDQPLYDAALPGIGSPSLAAGFPPEGPNFPVAGISGTDTDGVIGTITDAAPVFTAYNLIPNGNLQGMTVDVDIADDGWGTGFEGDTETRPIASHTNDVLTLGGLPLSDALDHAYRVGNGSELASPFVWPDRLDSDMTVQSFVNASPVGAPVWARYTGLVAALGTPTNTLVFNMGPAGYASFSATGDPSAPPGSPPYLCTPQSVKGIIQGEAFNIGTMTTDRTRECEQSGAYTIAQDFIRAGTTQMVTLTDTVNCTAENDISLANLDKDENLGDGMPTADIIHTGLPAGPYTVTFDVTNGALPADLEVELSIVSADGCVPQWVGGDLSIVSGVATSVLTDRAGLPNPFAPGASASLSYDYNLLSCTPGGFHDLQIVANVRSYVPSTSALFTDPTPGDAQAENHPEAFADDDVDGDTIPTPADNCPDDDNPGQEDFDGDGEGDACDPDIDNDTVPNATDDCDFVLEDLDGVDDDDGCPDTDASVIKTTPPTVLVDVSESENVPITVTVTNGNYEADVRVNLTAISLLGVCEVRLNPDLGAGDAYAEFTTDEDGNTVDETLYSMIERVEAGMAAGESRDVVRSYDIHCFDRSLHSGLVEIQADVVPMAPVVEEDIVNLPNVEKNYPDITAIDQADLKKVSLEVVGYDSAPPYDCAVIDPLPPSINVSEDVTLCVYQQMHNNGPVEAGFTDELTVTAPANCTATSPVFVVGSLLSGQTWGTTVPIVIHCTEPSFHGPFTFTNTISVDQLHTEDREPGNDSKSTNLPLVAVVGEVDILVDPVVIIAPGSINVSTTDTVTVNATITNLGPSTPVDVSWDIDASVATGCTLTPTSAIAGTILDLAGAQVVSATYDLHCTEGSYHVISADASAWPVADPHITEIDPGDNTDVAAITSTVQAIATADIKVQSVVCPALLWAPDNMVAVASSVTSTIHNNGPDNSPAAKQVVIDSATCSINGLVPPDPGIPVIINVPESDPAGSTKVEVDPFTVDIPAGSSCWYSVDVTKLAAADPHIIDNEPGNNNGSDLCLLCLDTDGDEVGNPGGDVLCGDDNCPDDPNGPAQAGIPGVGNQTDTDGDGVGDACDDTPFHDPDVKDRNFVVLGPAAVNLSDTNGRYMWVIAEVGNFSTHDELVQIALNLDIPAGLAANCVASPSFPNAGVVTSLILPGQDTFIMLTGEQKFVAWRVRFECHDPTTPGVYTIGGTVSITHLDIDGAGPHDGDEDADHILPHDHAPDHMGIGNNKSFSKEFVIE